MPKESSLKPVYFQLEQAKEDGYFTAAFVECGSFIKNTVFERWSTGVSAGQNIFDLASLSKALVLSPLIFNLSRSTNRPLDATVKEWLGSTAHQLPNNLWDLKVSHLLGHSSGLPAWRNFWINQLDGSTSCRHSTNNRHRLMEEVFCRYQNHEWKNPPVYSDVGMLLLSYLLEKLEGASVLECFKTKMANHLDLGSNAFLGGTDSNSALRSRCIPSAFCKLRNRMVQGEVHDENCYALGGFTGHAGLFGSGEGLSCLLRSGDRIPFWSDFLAANEKARLGGENLIGMRLGDDPSSKGFGRGRSLGHLGFTGTAFWMDYISGTYALFLTNRVISGRRSSRIKDLRRVVFSGLQDSID